MIIKPTVISPVMIRLMTDRRQYRQALAHFISNNILDRKKIIFIDCMNCIDQYMFERDDVEAIMESLFISRIELIYDLLDMLGSIQFNCYFQESDILLVSSYQRLLDIEEREAAYLRGKIETILARLDTRYIQVAVIELEDGTYNSA